METMPEKDNDLYTRHSCYGFEFRIVLLGDSKTGKTSIMNRLVDKPFTWRYHPTVEDHVTHVIEHGGRMCVCLMVDTCGRCDFPVMRQLSIVKSNACVVVYAVNDRGTFASAMRICEEIRSIKPPGEKMKLAIVANKRDCEQGREVNETEGKYFADSLNSEKVTALYFETTTKDKDDISRVFTGILGMFLPLDSEGSDSDDVAEKRERTKTTKEPKREGSTDKKKRSSSHRDTKKMTAAFSDTDLMRDRPVTSRSSKADDRLASVRSHVTSHGDSSDSDSPPTMSRLSKPRPPIRKKGSNLSLLVEDGVIPVQVVVDGNTDVVDVCDATMSNDERETNEGRLTVKTRTRKLSRSCNDLLDIQKDRSKSSVKTRWKRAFGHLYNRKSERDASERAYPISIRKGTL